MRFIDARMAGVTEDMWAAVKQATAEGRAVSDHDLPEPARDLLAERAELRERLAGTTA